MKKVVILPMIVVLLALIPTALANDPEPGTADDNACHTGGMLDGRCSSTWDWLVGWYLARWEQAGGHFGNYPFPEQYASSLPPVPPPPAAPAGAAAPAPAPLPTCSDPIPNTFSPSSTFFFRNGAYAGTNFTAPTTNLPTYMYVGFTSGDVVGHTTDAAGTGLVEVCLFP